MEKKDTHNIPKDYEKSVEKAHREAEPKAPGIVGDGKKIAKDKTKRIFHFNKKLAFTVIGIVIVTGAAIGFLCWTNVKKPGNDKAEDVAGIVTPEDVYNSTGNMLKESLNTDDLALKLSNYEDLASIALAANRLDEALDYAQKAEELGKNHTHAYVLGIIYENKGDRQKAIEYYELAMSRATPPTFEGENSPYTDYRLAKEALVN